MNPSAIFWPMLVHVGLVYGVYILLFLRRRGAVRAGKARISTFRENLNEPAESLFVRNNLASQFELPVLFHAGCLGLYVTGGVGVVAVVLAWAFALSRIAHTVIQVGSNRIRHRMPAFVIGFFAVAALWVALALRLLAEA